MCPKCGGSGSERCRHFAGMGTERCGNCSGRGVVSHEVRRGDIKVYEEKKCSSCNNGMKR